MLRCRLSENPGWFLCVSPGDRGWEGKGKGCLGRGKAGGRTERGGKGKGTQIPVNTRVVASEPRKPEHQLEVSERGKVEGKVFGMGRMDTKVSWEAVGNGPSSGTAAVY